MFGQKKSMFAGLATTLFVGVAVGGDFPHAYQIPVSQEAVFNVSGSATQGDFGGDAFLTSVVYPDGSEHREYYSPTRVTDLNVGASDGRNIRVRGGEHVTVGVPGLWKLGGLASRVESDTITQADVAAFEPMLHQVMANQNINNYMDTYASPQFSFVISFGRPVRDDDPLASDVHGELLFFERGEQGGNSWITMQAVDASGAALGPALAVSPEETFPTVPAFYLNQSGQMLGGLAIDVSRLGVSEVQHLRLRRTRTSDAGYRALMNNREDFNPDFKIMAVITHPDDMLKTSYD
ncbi:MAG: hypothetical protein V3V20_01905 [Algisphaera sp.]